GSPTGSGGLSRYSTANADMSMEHGHGQVKISYAIRRHNRASGASGFLDEGSPITDDLSRHCTLDAAAAPGPVARVQTTGACPSIALAWPRPRRRRPSP